MDPSVPDAEFCTMWVLILVLSFSVLLWSTDDCLTHVGPSSALTDSDIIWIISFICFLFIHLFCLEWWIHEAQAAGSLKLTPQLGFILKFSQHDFSEHVENVNIFHLNLKLSQISSPLSSIPLSHTHHIILYLDLLGPNCSKKRTAFNKMSYQIIKWKSRWKLICFPWFSSFLLGISSLGVQVCPSPRLTISFLIFIFPLCPRALGGGKVLLLNNILIHPYLIISN